MKNISLAVTLFILSCATTLITTPATADDREIQYFIPAADISGSGSLLTNENFAKAAINRVKQAIVSLDKGTWVKLKTFGDGSFKHFGNREIQISSRGATPGYVANLVESELNSIRAEAGDGNSSTNLLAFLELEELHCESGASMIYLITDAIEHSADVSSDDLLSGTQALPEPDEALLKGCAITIIGLGNVAGGLLPREPRRNLEKAWRDWFAQAGVDAIDIIYRP